MIQSVATRRVYAAIQGSSRKHPVQKKDLIMLTGGATRRQVEIAVCNLRKKGISVSSLPNIGYFLDATSVNLKYTKRWIVNMRLSRHLYPLLPQSIKWF